MTTKLDLSALQRFVDSKNTFRLTKLSSKRPNSMVGTRQFEQGDFYIHEYVETATKPQQFGVEISTGSMFGGFIRTSPVVKIVDQTEKSTTFETEGGVYLLEQI